MILQTIIYSGVCGDTERSNDCGRKLEIFQQHNDVLFQTDRRVLSDAYTTHGGSGIINRCFPKLRVRNSVEIWYRSLEDPWRGYPREPRQLHMGRCNFLRLMCSLVGATGNPSWKWRWGPILMSLIAIIAPGDAGKSRDRNAFAAPELFCNCCTVNRGYFAPHSKKVSFHYNTRFVREMFKLTLSYRKLLICVQPEIYWNRKPWYESRGREFALLLVLKIWVCAEVICGSICSHTGWAVNVSCFALILF